MRARLAIVALAALALALVAARSSQGAPDPRGSASALSVLVRIPGQADVTAGAVSGPPAESAAFERYAYPEDGGAVLLRNAATDVRRSPGAGERVQASSEIQSASLFGGELELEGIVLDARAVADGGRPSGALAGSSLASATILGGRVEPAPNERVELADWGYAVLLEQAVVHGDGEGRGYRGFVTAAHVYLTAAHAGLPAGSEILVGYAEAAVRAPAPASQPPAPGGTPEPAGAGAPAAVPAGASPKPPLIVRNPPPGVAPGITGRGWVFPVYGAAAYSDDFGAPRATTGWHHGNDIFASLGAPVLAVARGTVFSVGWNPVGGWRLWLRDEQGNEYYYAHLSAYSPLAEDGSHVEAGAVLGFVGDSGDAQGTPYHLHFEVHPAALLGLGYDGAIDPYPYLLAWAERRDASFAALSPAGPAPEPGAVLLDAEDISTASGLVPGALEQALGLAGEGVALPFAPGPPLVGAPPGFAG